MISPQTVLEKTFLVKRERERSRARARSAKGAVSTRIKTSSALAFVSKTDAHTRTGFTRATTLEQVYNVQAVGLMNGLAPGRVALEIGVGQTLCVPASQHTQVSIEQFFVTVFERVGETGVWALEGVRMESVLESHTV